MTAPDNQNNSEWEPRPMASDVEKAGLLADIDTMHDVYMSRAQREAYDRIKAAALTQPAASGELTPSLDRAVEAARMLRIYAGTTTAHANGDCLEARAVADALAALPHLSPGVELRAVTGEMADYVEQEVDPEIDVVDRWRVRLLTLIDNKQE